MGAKFVTIAAENGNNAPVNHRNCHRQSPAPARLDKKRSPAAKLHFLSFLKQVFEFTSKLWPQREHIYVHNKNFSFSQKLKLAYFYKIVFQIKNNIYEDNKQQFVYQMSRGLNLRIILLILLWCMVAKYCKFKGKLGVSRSYLIIINFLKFIAFNY